MNQLSFATNKEHRNTDSLIEFSNLDFIAPLLLFYGADIADILDDSVTHVIIDPGDTSRISKIRKRLKQIRRTTVPLVSAQWVTDSIEQHEDLDEREYPCCETATTTK